MNSIDDLEWSLKELTDALARADIALKMAKAVLSRETELQEQREQRTTQRYYRQTFPGQAGPPNVSP